MVLNQLLNTLLEVELLIRIPTFLHPVGIVQVIKPEIDWFPGKLLDSPQLFSNDNRSEVDERMVNNKVSLLVNLVIFTLDYHLGKLLTIVVEVLNV